MHRIVPVFYLSVSIVMPVALTACSSANAAPTSAEAVASKPKYAAYVTPSGKHVVPARLLKPVLPIYPPEAMISGAQGSFRICFKVDKHGQVENPHVVKEQGYPKGPGFLQLRKEALHVIKQWRYAPETVDGKRVLGEDCQDISFGLEP